MKKNFKDEPLFMVGDEIKHPKYGKGVICEVDHRMFPDYRFFYYAKFTDGGRVWLPKRETEKHCEKLN